MAAQTFPHSGGIGTFNIGDIWATGSLARSGIVQSAVGVNAGSNGGGFYQRVNVTLTYTPRAGWFPLITNEGLAGPLSANADVSAPVVYITGANTFTVLLTQFGSTVQNMRCRISIIEP